MPFYCFLGEGSPAKIDYRQKATLILTSLPEDLDEHGGKQVFARFARAWGAPVEVTKDECPIAGPKALIVSAVLTESGQNEPWAPLAQLGESHHVQIDFVCM